MPVKTGMKSKNLIPGGVEGLKERTKELIIKVGVLKGTGTYSTGVNVAQVAWWNEFGTKNIPARPFLRPTIYNNMIEYRKLIKAGIMSILIGKASFKEVSGKIGGMAQSAVQSRITEIKEPPNALSTIASKKSSNPLIDTGRLRQSIHWGRVK